MPRARKYYGVVYRRAGTQIWWIRYRDRKGVAQRESSQTADWDEANKKLRERLLARDANLLEVVRKGEALTYGQWADSFLENYSKPPMLDGEKLEQVVLALFQMNLSDDSGRRAWKSLPWSVMDSLHKKGYISDPATKNKSVWLSEEGATLSKELFAKLFAGE